MAQGQPGGAEARERSRVPALILLTLGTGFIDAASYLGLGHVFTSNMTGNVVILGFGVAGAPGFTIVAPLVSLVAFVLGALFGGVLVAHSDEARWPLPALWIELAALLAAALLAEVAIDQGDHIRYLMIVLVGGAMGVRNAAVRRLAVADLTTTVVTMNITGLAADSSVIGGDNRHAPRRIASIGSMIVGAVLGALLVQVNLALAFLAAAVIVLPTIVLFRRALAPS